jgi:hypothetical protein
VLDEYGDKTLVRAVDGAVHHHRSMRLTVLTDVLQLETLRHLEIQLRRIELPGATQGILNVDVDFWSIEGALTGLDFIRQPVLLQRRAQVGFGDIP